MSCWPASSGASVILRGARVVVATAAVVAAAALAVWTLWYSVPVQQPVEDLRDRVVAQLRERLGSDVELAGLVLALDPPVIAIARLASPTGDWEVEGIRLPVDPAALLRGEFASESATAERLWLHVTPAFTLFASGLRGRLAAASPSSSVEFDITGRADGGGQLHCSGSVDPTDGSVVLHANLERLPIAPLAALFPQWGTLAGRATGTIELQGQPRSPARLDVDLSLDGLRLHAEKLELEEALSVRAQLAALVAGEGAGKFEIDATQARMRYADHYEKPVGKSAHLTGLVVRTKRGKLALDEMHLRIGKSVSEPDGKADGDRTLSRNVGTGPESGR